MIKAFEFFFIQNNHSVCHAVKHLNGYLSCYSKAKSIFRNLDSDGNQRLGGVNDIL